MFGKLLYRIALFLKPYLEILSRITKMLPRLILALIAGLLLTLAGSKIYQNWDDHADRGAIAISNGAFQESYGVPVYLDQGWKPSDSLWFYNTTQGSGLLPYDFFLVLEAAGSSDCKSEEDGAPGCLRSNRNMDEFRYLPQTTTLFNPDALPVGFTKDEYRGRDYVGYTCAACHTAQINYAGKAIRIDGGPAMADMGSFMAALQEAMEATLEDAGKLQRFTGKVIGLRNNYRSEDQVIADLKKWTATIGLYNTVNHTKIDYGYARLDAFGRIYNRVLQHVINKKQLGNLLAQVTIGDRRLLTRAQITLVLAGVDPTIIRDDDFALIIERLRSSDPGLPGLSFKEMLYVRNEIFNEPNAPVSYPFLWDIAQSDYVQWNGIASNAGPGPLGRNAGEVIGVFGILDWQEDTSWFGISSWLRKYRLSTIVTGQGNKNKAIDFDSSINLFNLQRLESHLRGLQSPEWPEDILGKLDPDQAGRGELLYAEYCLQCHEIIDRDNSERKVIANMLAIGKAGTDPAMARNSVAYGGKSGNFKHTYQSVTVGRILVEEDAPVAEILTIATTGVVTTPDPDKWFPRRWAEWVYTLASSIFDNDIKASIKRGNYNPDTTANPYNSLLSYKARSLNGIWATAPYLHNGSVPTLYHLLLPVRPEGATGGDYRPDQFMVGSREFDPVKVGFRSAGYDGFKFDATARKRPGNRNSGHTYGTKMNEEERRDLLEYLKSL
jgi:hypothetical protein